MSGSWLLQDLLFPLRSDHFELFGKALDSLVYQLDNIWHLLLSLDLDFGGWNKHRKFNQGDGMDLASMSCTFVGVYIVTRAPHVICNIPQGQMKARVARDANLMAETSEFFK